MTPEMAVLLEDELAAAEQRIAELEAFVAWVAHHSCQRDIGAEAHRLLGHAHSPRTVALLAELRDEARR